MARFIISLLVLSLLSNSAFAQNLTYIIAGKMIDVEGAQTLSNQMIIIEGERIKKTGPRSDIAIPIGSNIIDLSNYTVMPGLIDAHAHINQSSEDHGYKVFTRSEGGDAIQGVVNAATILRRGFTAARVPGT